MSYWTYMEIDTGGTEPAQVAEIGNMTSNVSGMWADALGKPLREFDGVVGAVLLPIMDAAVARLKDSANEAKYRAMEPVNKWGSLESATMYLEKIRDACREHPRAHLSVSC